TRATGATSASTRPSSSRRCGSSSTAVLQEMGAQPFSRHEAVPARLAHRLHRHAPSSCGRAVFGNYISVYDIQRAEQDGATVPIYYERLLPELFLTWLDEQDGPKPPKPTLPRTDHSEVAVRRPAHFED